MGVQQDVVATFLHDDCVMTAQWKIQARWKDWWLQRMEGYFMAAAMLFDAGGSNKLIK